MGLIKFKHSTTPSFAGFFDDFLSSDLFDDVNFYQKASWTPSVNIKENEKEFSLEMAIPGFSKENFEVNVENNILTISSAKKEEKEEKAAKENYVRREFHYSSFKRSFTLNEKSIDTDNIEARYENGILHISIPKKVVQVEKKNKTIAIA